MMVRGTSVVVKLPKELHENLSREAKETLRSITKVVELAVREYFDKKKAA